MAVRSLSPVVRPQYDWEGDTRPGLKMADLVIYEAHVRGFTRHPSSATRSLPGTYKALAEKLPYLKVRPSPLPPFWALAAHPCLSPGPQKTW